jgi:hypothetical protein
LVYRDFERKDKITLLGSYIICRVLINKILLRPQENGMNTHITKKTQTNLKLLGSMILGIFISMLYDMYNEKNEGERYEYHEDEIEE